MRGMTLCAILTIFGSTAWTQTGITYRFQADTIVGRVWVVGDDARRELEAGEGGTAAGRWIERGEPVSGTSALILSDIREVTIASDRFEVPKEYRFQEPELVPPVRRHP